MGIAALRLSPATMPNPMRKKNHMQQARGDCPAAKEKALQQQSRIPCASHAAVGSRARLLQDQSRARRRRCRRGWGAAATVRVGEDGEEPRLCAPARVAETAGAASWRHPARICRGHRQLAALGKEEVVALTRVRHSARRCPPSLGQHAAGPRRPLLRLQADVLRLAPAPSTAAQEGGTPDERGRGGSSIRAATVRGWEGEREVRPDRICAWTEEGGGGGLALLGRRSPRPCSAHWMLRRRELGLLPALDAPPLRIGEEVVGRQGEVAAGRGEATTVGVGR
jgi:hypothetical protein